MQEATRSWRWVLRRTALQVAVQHRTYHLALSYRRRTRSPRRACARSLSNSAMAPESPDNCFSWLLPLVFQVVLLEVHRAHGPAAPAGQASRTVAVRSTFVPRGLPSELPRPKHLQKLGPAAASQLGLILLNGVTRSGSRWLADECRACISLVAADLAGGPVAVQPDAGAEGLARH